MLDFFLIKKKSLLVLQWTKLIECSVSRFVSKSIASATWSVSQVPTATSGCHEVLMPLAVLETWHQWQPTVQTRVWLCLKARNWSTTISIHSAKCYINQHKYRAILCSWKYILFSFFIKNGGTLSLSFFGKACMPQCWGQQLLQVPWKWQHPPRKSHAASLAALMACYSYLPLGLCSSLRNHRQSDLMLKSLHCFVDWVLELVPAAFVGQCRWKIPHPFRH